MSFQQSFKYARNIRLYLDRKLHKTKFKDLAAKYDMSLARTREVFMEMRLRIIKQSVTRKMLDEYMTDDERKVF